jgi:hypothetical protein
VPPPAVIGLAPPIAGLLFSLFIRLPPDIMLKI